MNRRHRSGHGIRPATPFTHVGSHMRANRCESQSVHTVFTFQRKRGNLTAIGCARHAAMSRPRLFESRL